MTCFCSIHMFLVRVISNGEAIFQNDHSHLRHKVCSNFVWMKLCDMEKFWEWSYDCNHVQIILSLHQPKAMAKDNGKCGANCDCAAGTCAKENGGKCGNCDCAAGNWILLHQLSLFLLSVSQWKLLFSFLLWSYLYPHGWLKMMCDCRNLRKGEWWQVWQLRLPCRNLRQGVEPSMCSHVTMATASRPPGPSV